MAHSEGEWDADAPDDLGVHAMMLGLSAVDMTASSIAHCNSWAYYVDPVCWAYSRAAWEQAGQFPAPPLPAPPAPISLTPTGNPNCPTPPYDCAAEIAAGIASGMTATQAQNSAFFSQIPAVPPSCGLFSSPTLGSDGVTFTCTSMFGSGTVLIAVAAIAAAMFFSTRRS